MAQTFLDTGRDQASGAERDALPGIGVGGTADSAGAAGAARALRQLLLRLHFFAGVLVAPFLLVATLSGMAYALSPALEKVVDHHALTAASGEQRVPLANQIRTATARHPDLTLSGVVPGSNGATTRVLFADRTLPSSSYQRVVFVDPSDGSVHDDTVQYGSTGALPLRTWIDELHRRLHIGDAGRLYAELAASWLAPLTLGGVLLWWDRRRRQRRRETVVPTSATAAAGGTGRRVLLRRHAVLGSWIALGLLVLSVTGLTWSTYAGGRVADARAALDWKTPALTPIPAGTTAPEGDHAGHEHGGPDGAPTGGVVPVADQAAPVLAAARHHGLDGTVQLTPPAAPGAPWLVKETRKSWTDGPDAVSIDPLTGAAVQRIPFDDFPVAAKLTDWGIRVHMGFLFGLPNQLVLAALAGALLVMIVRGYRMWWARRPGRRWGRAPTRGALRDLFRAHPVRTVAGGAVVAAIGWALPLLGLSLLAFLAVDALLGLRARHTDLSADREPAESTAVGT